MILHILESFNLILSTASYRKASPVLQADIKIPCVHPLHLRYAIIKEFFCLFVCLFLYYKVFVSLHIYHITRLSSLVTLGCDIVVSLLFPHPRHTPQMHHPPALSHPALCSGEGLHHFSVASSWTQSWGLGTRKRWRNEGE